MNDIDLVKEVRGYAEAADKNGFDVLTVPLSDLLPLIERLEAAEKLAEFRLKSINSMDALVADRDRRIAELESWVRGVEEAMISATDHAAAAERERDELRAWHDTLQRAVDNLHAERDVLRAEIARRDAAAGEAVAWQFYDDGSWHNGSNHNNHRENTEKAGYRIRELCVMGAQPALLPPEKPVNTDLSRTDIMKNIAYNQALNDVKSLGAQPQKPVALPESVRINNGYYFNMDDIFDALDAANVPWR